MRRMRAYHLVHTHLVWESVQCSKFEGMCQVNNKTARTQLQLLLLFLVLSLLPILPSQSVEDVKESAYTTQCTAIVIYPLLNLRTHQIEWGGRRKSRIQIHIMSLVFTFCCIGAMCNSPWKRQQQHIVFVTATQEVLMRYPPWKHFYNDLLGWVGLTPPQISFSKVGLPPHENILIIHFPPPLK